MFWVHGGPGLLFGLLGNILWWLLLLLLISSLVRMFVGGRRWGSFRYPPGPPPHQRGPFGPPPLTALQILQQRYARGEIDGTTFDQMRERLEASEHHGQP